MLYSELIPNEKKIKHQSRKRGFIGNLDVNEVVKPIKLNYWYLNKLYNQFVSADLKVDQIFAHVPGENPDKKIGINFLSFFPDLNLVSYGANFESMDGEFVPFLMSKEYFEHLESQFSDFVSKIKTEVFDKSDFFATYSVSFTKNHELTVDERYIRFFILFIIYATFNQDIKLFNNNVNKALINFLKYITPIKQQILTYLPTSERRTILNMFQIQTFTTSGKTRDVGLGDIFADASFKVTPVDQAETYRIELNAAENVSKLVYNKVCPFFPLTIRVYYSKYLFSNPNVVTKLKNTDIYEQKLHEIKLLRQRHFVEEEEKPEHDKPQISILSPSKFKTKRRTMTKSKSSSGESSDDEDLGNLYEIQAMGLLKRLEMLTERQIFNKDRSVVMIMENAGFPLYDLPIRIGNFQRLSDRAPADSSMFPANILKANPNAKIATTTLDRMMLIYVDFEAFLFKIIWSLLCLNIKLGVYHNDLHLNNLLINARSHFFYSDEISENLKDVYSKQIQKHGMEEIDRKFKGYLHASIIQNIAKKRRTAFVFGDEVTYSLPTSKTDPVIIDFSRVVSKDDKYDLIHEAMMFLEAESEELTKDVSLEYKLAYAADHFNAEFFETTCGIDLYNTLGFIEDHLFSDESFNKYFIEVLKLNPWVQTEEMGEIKQLDKSLRKLFDEMHEFVLHVHEFIVERMVEQYTILSEAIIDPKSVKKIVRTWNINQQILEQFYTKYVVDTKNETYSDYYVLDPLEDLILNDLDEFVNENVIIKQ